MNNLKEFCRQVNDAAPEFVILGGDVTDELTSYDDMRAAWSDLVDPFPEAGALVVADHQPYDEEQLAVESSVLQLSGHTHAGQLWPLQIVYRMLGLPALGGFEEPDTLLYVSAGVGFWSIPLRTEANCTWELITLVP